MILLNSLPPFDKVPHKQYFMAVHMMLTKRESVAVRRQFLECIEAETPDLQITTITRDLSQQYGVSEGSIDATRAHLWHKCYAALLGHGITPTPKTAKDVQSESPNTLNKEQTVAAVRLIAKAARANLETDPAREEGAVQELSTHLQKEEAVCRSIVTDFIKFGLTETEQALKDGQKVRGLPVSHRSDEGDLIIYFRSRHDLGNHIITCLKALKQASGQNCTGTDIGVAVLGDPGALKGLSTSPFLKQLRTQLKGYTVASTDFLNAADQVKLFTLATLESNLPRPAFTNFALDQAITRPQLQRWTELGLIQCSVKGDSGIKLRNIDPFLKLANILSDGSVAIPFDLQPYEQMVADLKEKASQIRPTT